jgi:hypothetical protein
MARYWGHDWQPILQFIFKQSPKFWDQNYFTTISKVTNIEPAPIYNVHKSFFDKSISLDFTKGPRSVISTTTNLPSFIGNFWLLVNGNFYELPYIYFVENNTTCSTFPWNYLHSRSMCCFCRILVSRPSQIVFCK